MKVPKLADLEDERLHLIRFIEQYSPQGSSNNSVTIIFDGSMEVFGGMSSRSAKIVFSQGESADDKIKDIVAKSSNAKSIVVVSDDRGIGYAVKALGAKIASVRAFLDKAKLPKGKGRSPKARKERSPSSEKIISKCDESKITTEMGKIWLKSNHKRLK